jgi:hypothetical protein
MSDGDALDQLITSLPDVEPLPALSWDDVRNSMLDTLGELAGALNAKGYDAGVQNLGDQFAQIVIARARVDGTFESFGTITLGRTESTAQSVSAVIRPDKGRMSNAIVSFGDASDRESLRRLLANWLASFVRSP